MKKYISILCALVLTASVVGARIDDPDLCEFWRWSDANEQRNAVPEDDAQASEGLAPDETEESMHSFLMDEEVLRLMPRQVAILRRMSS